MSPAPDAESTNNDHKHGVHSWLSGMVPVRRGEWKPVALAAAYMFFVLSSYYLVRPVRDALGLSRGADKLPMLFTGTMLAMLLVNPVYAALASRFPRRVFIPVAYRFFMINILLFFALMQAVDERFKVGLGYAFYIWLSVFNLFAISIFWAVMADRFNSEQGKRLFALIGVGGTLGAIAGAGVTWQLVEGWKLGETLLKVEPDTMLLFSIVPIELAVQCAKRLIRQESSAHSLATRSEREPSRDVMEGFRLLVRSPYLALICGYVFIFAITSTVLNLELNVLIEKEFPDKASRTATFARLDVWTNTITLIMQAFLTSRIIRWIGVGGTMSLVPLVTLVGFAALLMHSSIMVVGVFQVVRRAMHYAVDRPARETLYTVVGPDAKYKTKSFIDTFVYRFGDQIGAWGPMVLGRLGVAAGYVAVPLAAVWIVLALVLGSLQRRRIAQEAHAISSEHGDRPVGVRAGTDDDRGNPAAQ